ncbi:MAG: hypothetical protein M0030_18770 [Actinomycetota bacterium]|nr:hypothetical protein [Actinomycetota bacterium]
MTALIIADLAGALALAAAITGLLRWSARLAVVEWHGPGDHPRHAPRLRDGAAIPRRLPARESAALEDVTR